MKTNSFSLSIPKIFTKWWSKENEMSVTVEYTFISKGNGLLQSITFSEMDVMYVSDNPGLVHFVTYEIGRHANDVCGNKRAMNDAYYETAVHL